MHIPVGIRSLAISLPSIIRTNDYYREKYPDIVAKAEDKNLAKFMSLANSTPSNEYELAMEPYLKDPFRGTVKRPILGPGESALTLEYRAAKDALAAGNFTINDIDLLIVSSFLPDQPGFGNAAFLARELGMQCPAWNLDASCASGPMALQTATALIQSGTYRNILVVISCTYSRLVDENDTLSWFFGDAAGAYVVGSLSHGQGLLASKAINTSFTCNQFSVKDTVNEEGKHRLRFVVARDTNKIIAENAPNMIKTCCEGAVAAAGLKLDDIDFFISTTPTAWFVDLCTHLLHIDPKRTINLYPECANIGGALTLFNLYHAAKMGKIRENDLVLLYGFGAASSSVAIVMRWGDVKVAD
ncbi:3-oxoacyl-ACP synthase III family protein [Calothrix sp. NIES-3974]|uniref:3-oxoacyl-ACP synthase III family protein n=1 Tax=Calothrix sp. NIES-3974 TaxID=2005462 RepID=UPI000B5E5F37|nr:3-oxoacyl-ACP synthase III family protein [Calothrix sp. NIES-3974]BAZ03481.1 3-oxoacyl-[acyl-carrier-protein] synthase III [Calothrix sp. NIES-3974]